MYQAVNTDLLVQNFILVAGAETRRTFAEGEERKYPGNCYIFDDLLR